MKIRKTDKIVHILHVTYGMDRGGIETFLMEVLRNIDRDKFKVTFLLNERNGTYDHEEEIVRLGASIIRAPRLKRVGPFIYVKHVKAALLNNQVDIVHAHMSYHSAFALISSKLAKVNIRIAHSHNTTAVGANNLLMTAYRWICQKIILRTATHRMACSMRAGEILFSGKSFLTIANGIDISKYAYSTKNRNDIRSELRLKDKTKILLHVARMVDVKNQTFLLEIFREYLALQPDAVLLMVGDGPLKDSLVIQAKTLGIDGQIIFLGSRSDTQRFYSAADVILLPSLAEGLPLTLVEAQANGLPCIVSTGVPPDVNITGTVQFYHLNEPTSFWAKAIASVDSQRYNNTHMLEASDYNIVNGVKKLEDTYINSMRRA